MGKYTPKMVCFSCKFGWGYLSENGYDKSIENLVPVMCSGKVNASHIVDAFRKGADGVLILGCPEGECHYQNGNYQARKRILLLKRTLRDFGIEPRRLKIVFDIDPEGTRIKSAINLMKSELQNLGPLSPSV
ncbi:MAG TPA: hydrogenase iron-sulfur subunit [Deltaproteobacteria bacterium]|nr:hydrogenase iron-sulfur subunit [Deltaproteobacteria bacterium]